MLNELKALNVHEVYKDIIRSDRVKQAAGSPRRAIEKDPSAQEVESGSQELVQQDKLHENHQPTLYGQMKMIKRLQKAGGVHISSMPSNPDNHTARAFLVEEVMKYMVERKKLVFQESALTSNPRDRVNRLIVRSDKQMNKKFIEANKELLREQDSNYRRLKRLRQPVWSLAEIDDFLARIGYTSEDEEQDDEEQQGSPYEAEISDQIIQKIRLDPHFKNLLSEIYQQTLVREIKKKKRPRHMNWKK